MLNEIRELLDLAMDREIAAEAFYIAGQRKTTDPGAVDLMRELAAEESKHYRRIKALKEDGLNSQKLPPGKLADLMLSEYLVDTPISEAATLQDVITAAMKREQYSQEFYAKMTQLSENKAFQQLCERLMQEERKHKAKLEIFYDDFFYKEN
jgi:rubrerythrin